MITNDSSINIYNTNDLSTNGGYFTGGLNFQELNFDPIVTGYAFIFWTKLPKWVVKMYPGFAAMTQKNFKSFDGISDIELQVQEYNYGFANNEYAVAGGITKANTDFTIRHQEYSGNPIKNMYTAWVSGIADPETGIATYPRTFGMDYAAKNHTGELIYIVTRPDANNTSKTNIEFAAYYTNVMPTRIPLGHLNYSQGDHNLVELDIPFRGNMHIGAKVDKFAKQVLSSNITLADSYTFATEGMFDPEKTPSDLYGNATLTTFDESDTAPGGNNPYAIVDINGNR